MLGAIAGDIVGSPYEAHNFKSTDFPLFGPRSCFTDDTVLTVATAQAILDGEPYAQAYRRWCRRYPRAGYGPLFGRWCHDDQAGPYRSCGNGSAMRVSPVGWACGSLEEVLRQAELSAECTHNHPEGVKGAQAVAAALWLARTGATKEAIGAYVSATFGYRLRPLAEIRATYRFDPTCQGTVPEALSCFLESAGFEDALRQAVSIGGDSDTIACIAGAVAEAFWGGVPGEMEREVFARLDTGLAEVVRRFRERYPVGPLP